MGWILIYCFVGFVFIVGAFAFRRSDSDRETLINGQPRETLPVPAPQTPRRPVKPPVQQPAEAPQSGPLPLRSLLSGPLDWAANHSIGDFDGDGAQELLLPQSGRPDSALQLLSAGGEKTRLLFGTAGRVLAPCGWDSNNDGEDEVLLIADDPPGLILLDRSGEPVARFAGTLLHPDATACIGPLDKSGPPELWLQTGDTRMLVYGGEGRSELEFELPRDWVCGPLGDFSGDGLAELLCWPPEAANKPAASLLIRADLYPAAGPTLDLRIAGVPQKAVQLDRDVASEVLLSSGAWLDFPGGKLTPLQYPRGGNSKGAAGQPCILRREEGLAIAVLQPAAPKHSAALLLFSLQGACLASTRLAQPVSRLESIDAADGLSVLLLWSPESLQAYP